MFEYLTNIFSSKESKEENPVTPSHPYDLLKRIPDQKNRFLTLAHYTLRSERTKKSGNTLALPKYTSANCFDEKKVLLDKFQPDVLDSLEKIESCDWLIRPYIESNHSAVLYFPMIDMLGLIHLQEDMHSFCYDVAVTCGLTEYHVFNSGNSYHAYFLPLISRKQWHSFLDEVLFLSQRFESPLSTGQQMVDKVWLRLQPGGQSGLRWTGHTKPLPTHHLSGKV